MRILAALPTRLLESRLEPGYWIGRLIPGGGDRGRFRFSHHCYTRALPDGFWAESRFDRPFAIGFVQCEHSTWFLWFGLANADRGNLLPRPTFGPLEPPWQKHTAIAPCSNGSQVPLDPVAQLFQNLSPNSQHGAARTARTGGRFIHPAKTSPPQGRHGQCVVE